MKIEKISIVGTGYVGLVTAVGFASKGYMTIASTHDSKKVALINKGIAPYYEPDLKDELETVVKNGYLECMLYGKNVVLDTDATFIAVGTPSQKDGSIDLRFIKKSAREIGQALKEKSAYHLVVAKSTVVPGTTEKVVKPTIEKYSNKRCGSDFGLCMNPEFLREGSALYDTLHPDRIVIGELDARSGEILESFYKEFYGKGIPPIFRTSSPTAELVKYANNAFLASKISFINTIANVCEKIPGVDVKDVAKAIGVDKRIGPLFLNAGLGFGGSCLPKDVKALISFSKSLNYEPPVILAAEEVNSLQPHRAVAMARSLIGDLKGKRVAILGLAFKPETDDMREATSIKIVNKLLREGARVIVYDPVAVENARVILGDNVTYASTALECISNTDCCIVATEWNEFRNLKPLDFIKHMKNPAVVDGRRVYDPKVFSRELKFAAIGFGQ